MHDMLRIIIDVIKIAAAATCNAQVSYELCMKITWVLPESHFC